MGKGQRKTEQEQRAVGSTEAATSKAAEHPLGGHRHSLKQTLACSTLTPNPQPRQTTSVGWCDHTGACHKGDLLPGGLADDRSTRDSAERGRSKWPTPTPTLRCAMA